MSEGNGVRCCCGKEDCDKAIYVDSPSGDNWYVGLGDSGMYLDANGIVELIRILKEALLAE